MEHDLLFKKRHSLAHLLAMAALEHDPLARLSVGPVTENGFYYDIDFSEGKTPTPDDLKTLEKSMRKFVNKKFSFSRREVTTNEARTFFKGNPYKLAIVGDIEKGGAEITLYDTDSFTPLEAGAHSESSRPLTGFTDLCEGPHIENTGEIDAKSFTLTHLAGAYWRGDEQNPMLTRIYGLAFDTEAELDTYLAQQEEAKKRDHKKLGIELDLFTFSDLVGSGLPLWTPRGTIIRNLLDEYIWSMRQAVGYQKVEIPHITKKDLYEKSGHWDKFKDELFRITTREGHEFAMKPMNCPHHTQIYARRQWSYRELPQRYANSTACYRDEQSGELSGLSRVRAFTQDDAHVFCRNSQIHEEILKIWDIVTTFYGSFGFELQVRISKHDPATPEKFLGDKETWKLAEEILSDIAIEKNANAFEGIGEAAFYGPKLDFMAKDALGREWQVATIQLDMNMPERFDLFCINETGERERIVMIHAAIMGSIERFMSILIEHTAGAFPFWLAPVQVAILPVSEDIYEYAKGINLALKKLGYRTEMKMNETLGKRIRETKVEKIPYTLVLGKKEVEEKTVTLESYANGKVGVLPLPELLELLANDLREKR